MTIRNLCLCVMVGVLAFLVTPNMWTLSARQVEPQTTMDRIAALVEIGRRTPECSVATVGTEAIYLCQTNPRNEPWAVEATIVRAEWFTAHCVRSGGHQRDRAAYCDVYAPMESAYVWAVGGIGESTPPKIAQPGRE